MGTQTYTRAHEKKKKGKKKKKEKAGQLQTLPLRPT
jgi:hypothetical protein